MLISNAILKSIFVVLRQIILLDTRENHPQFLQGLQVIDTEVCFILSLLIFEILNLNKKRKWILCFVYW